jgi:DNA-binding transcriptional LysR family regulator
MIGMIKTHAMKTPDLDLDLVRCFLAIAETGSFTLASQRLNLSQSAVSLKIQRLEGLLDRKVFIRSRHSLELTPEGDLVLGYSRRLLDLSQEMLLLVAQPAVEGILRLGVVQQFGPEFLPNLLAQFKRQHPNVCLTVEVGMTPDLLLALEADQLDLVLGLAGCTPGPGAKINAFTEDRIVLREPLVWVEGAQSSIDPKKDPVPLILFAAPCSFRKLATELMEKAGRPWQIVYSSASLASIQAAVQAGLGISILGKSSVLSGMCVISPRSGLPALPDSALALYSRKSPFESLVRSLSTFVANAISEWQKEQSSKTKPNGLIPKRRKYLQQTSAS